MTRRCETCEFRSVQECRRYPPVITESRGRKEWPMVEWSDWCGEWSPNEKVRQEALALELKMLDEYHAIMHPNDKAPP